MKVIIFIPNLDFGGVASYVLRCKEMFSNTKYEANVVCFNNQRNSENVIELEGNGLKQQIQVLRKFLKKEKVKVIITSVDIAPVIVKIASLFLGIKIISVFHMRPELYKIKSSNKIKSFILNKIMISGFLISDKIIAVSKGLENEINQIYPFLKKKTVCIYNPIINQVQQEELIFKDVENKEVINILNVGWIYDLKNQIEILKAIKDIKKQFRVNFIGGIKDELYYKELKRYIEEYNLNEVVNFTGEVSNPEEYFKNADIYISTSKAEALPTVLIEALDNNLPIIAKDCKYGPREILCDEKYGLLYEGNEIELKNKILEMIDNKKYNKFRKESYERAKNFSFDKILKEYTKIIDII